MKKTLHFFKMKSFSRSFSFIQKTLLVAFLFALSCPLSVNAQGQTLTGTVTSSTDNEPLPGVNVVIKGTTTGTVTDFDGKFSLKANSTDVLVISFIGFLDEEITVGNQSDISIGLVEDISKLNEVVVIGYGVQKKKLNTGATVNVKGDDLQKLNTATPMDALKGISSGVSITQNNGVPGSGTKVTIRGTGTIGASGPLYVVDGVSVGDIDFLAPSDIESIDVLKDAASCAIYGSRAANGVILVTTKKGTTKNKPTITYDFYNGWSSVYKKPELLNAQQYIEIIDESRLNSGVAAVDWANTIPRYDEIQAGTYAGTNWFDEFENEGAQTKSHAINITGGNKSSIYSMGYSTLREEGIIGTGVNNVYERQNFRLNSEHVIIERADRSFFKIGENLTYSHFKKPTIRTGNIYWNDVHNMLVTSPVLPMYATDETDPAYPYHYATSWESGETNPVWSARRNSQNNYNNNNSIVGNIYGELELIPNLKLRSSYGVNSWFGNSRSWTPAFDAGPRTSAPRDMVDQSSWLGFTWTATNTIAYNFNVQNMHNFATVIGTETQKNAMSNTVTGHNENSIFQDYEHAYLNNVKEIDPTYTKVEGKDEYGWGMQSYFGRLSYDFNETFLATAVLRADGSSRFAKENRWGYFPSISMGYILSNHDFMKSIPGLNYFKVRGSYGQNGNENIESYQHLSTLSYSMANYYFGPDKTQQSIGAWPARVPNPDVTWETSEQTSLGFDANFLNNKLQFNFDVYNKTTKDWLVNADQLDYFGTNSAYINGGEVVNKGLEMSLRWNEQRGEFTYGASASLSYNNNEVTAIDNFEKIFHGQSSVLSQGTSEMYRAEVGYPIGYFWGYETDGILQNQADVDAWVSPNGNPYFANAQPGDVRFVNQNGDSVINEDDKVMIGDPNPDFIFGFQVNAEYKGFYAMVSANGQAGHQIAKSYRSFADSPKQNYTMDVYDRWHGEGTSNTNPRLVAAAHRNYQYVSDLYIEDANFLRINNITVGYDFNRLWSASPLQQFRVYFTGKNLITFTKYSGMDPEVGYGPDDWASGIDLGLYPASKIYMIGISAKF